MQVQQSLVESLSVAKVRPVVVASHPRSGTHLLIDSLRLNVRDCRSRKLWGEALDRLYVSLDALLEGSSRVTPGVALRVLQRTPRPLVKTHNFRLDDLGATRNPEELALRQWILQSATFLYTYRDGRAVLASYHQFMQGFDPETRVPLGTFLRQRVGGVSRVKAWANHVQGWLSHPEVYAVSMEELLSHREVVLAGIAQHVGCVLDRRVPRLPHKTQSPLKSRLNRFLTRCPSSTAIVAAQPTPPWRSAFTADDRAFFREEVGDLLIKLGYEESDAWVDEEPYQAPRFPAGFYSCPQPHGPRVRWPAVCVLAAGMAAVPALISPTRAVFGSEPIACRTMPLVRSRRRAPRACAAGRRTTAAACCA